MAARVLRHYKVAASTIAATILDITGPVPANRALVIGKIVVTNRGTITASSFDVFVGSQISSDFIASSVAIAPGETYVESGLIALAGESVLFRAVEADTRLTCAVFGEEVDN